MRPVLSEREDYLMKIKGTQWGLGIGSGQGVSAVLGAWERGCTLTSAWCTLFECLSLLGGLFGVASPLWKKGVRKNSEGNGLSKPVARRVSHRIFWCEAWILQHYLAKILRASWLLCKQMPSVLWCLSQNTNAYWMSQWVTVLSMLDPLSHRRGNLLTLDTNFGPEQRHLVI